MIKREVIKMKGSLFVLVVLFTASVLMGAVFAVPGGGPPNPAVISGYAHLDDVAIEGATVNVYASDKTLVSSGQTNVSGIFGPILIDEFGLNDGDLLSFTINGHEANGSLEYHPMMGISLVDLFASSDDCSLPESQLTVESDKTEYLAGENITLSGIIRDEDCDGIASVEIAIQVEDSNGLAIVVEQVISESDGTYSHLFTLESDAPLGVYSVAISGNSLDADTTFEVVESLPDCEENWTCTEWDPAICDIDETQTRTCTDQNSCGTEENKPAETQNCTCVPVWECTEWSDCINGTMSRTCSDTWCDADDVTYTINCTENMTCDADGDGHDIPACGGDDCSDENAAVYPGASCSTDCRDSGATYDENCTCTGGTDTCPPSNPPAPSGGVTGGSSYTSGGYTPPACEPEWSCTEWSPKACPSTGMQTRLCADDNECDTSEGRPDVSRTCEYIDNTAVICGDSVCEGDETCSNCESDCGACGIAPSGTLCGNGICESTENCDSCESDCGECPKPEPPAEVSGGGLGGLFTASGAAGLGGITVLIVAIILIGYVFATRQKGNDDDFDDE